MIRDIEELDREMDDGRTWTWMDEMDYLEWRSWMVDDRGPLTWITVVEWAGQQLRA